MWEEIIFWALGALMLFVVIVTLTTLRPVQIVAAWCAEAAHCIADAMREGWAISEPYVRSLITGRPIARRDENLDYVAPPQGNGADQRADGQTDKADSALQSGLSELHKAADYLRVDHNRIALVRVLVEAGWNVGDIRNAVKGDNGTIGEEIRIVQATRGEPLAEAPPPEPKVLRIRDDQGERIVPMEGEIIEAEPDAPKLEAVAA
jgi:hypothetical protein